MKKLLAALAAASLLSFSLGSISCSMDSNDSRGSSSTENNNNNGNSGNTNTGNDDEYKSVTLTVNEGDTALVSVSAGTVKADTTNYYGWTGKGYYDSLGTGTVIYSIYSPVEQDAQLLLHYAYWGNRAALRVAKVVVNGASDDELLYCNWTNTKRQSDIWQDTNAITVHLDAGDNQIRLSSADKTIALSEQTYNEDGTVNTPGYVFPSGADTDYTRYGGVYADEVKTCDGNLPNLDYLQITGLGLASGSNSTAFSTATVTADVEANGTVSFEPAQDFYKQGSTVTITAVPADGYVFDCWYGDESSTDQSYTMTMDSDKTVYAHFIPSGYSNEGLYGYASIADDTGTPYTISGGANAQGNSITISSLSDLTENADLLKGSDPYVVYVKGLITTANETYPNVSKCFTIGSNKTLTGSSSAQFQNVGIKITGTNVIIKNITFGEVISDDYFAAQASTSKGTGDAVEINGGTRVWIDHCEFKSHLTPMAFNASGVLEELEFDSSKTSISVEHDNECPEIAWRKDYYDGLLDIKNQATHITVSNSYFHDHYKACLIGSNDTDDREAVLRITFYGNYWENINARAPLVRFGKAHVFNSYFKADSSENCKWMYLSDDKNGSTYSFSTNSQATAINCRASSEVYADNNCFENIKTAIGHYNGSSDVPGTWTTSGNDGFSDYTGNSYVPPYTWNATDAASAKENCVSNAGVK